MKNSSQVINSNMSNNSRSILFGRGRTNQTSLYTPDELRLIRFDKVDNKYLGFHKKAEKRCGLDVLEMFDEFLKKL
jgi:hypothetical protein